ncbi:MAG: class I SAM-dependent methyltransferase [Pseudomonadota bacterium]
MNSGSEDYRRRWLERRQRREAPQVAMEAVESGSVRHLYEHYPYPSREQTAPIRDLSNAIELLLEDRDLRGWRVLDAGCGTGQRLVGMARQFPDAAFTGFDLSSSSLDVAAALAQRHGLTNVTLIQGDLSGGDLPGEYDLVVSTGVIHHLPSPRAGVEALTRTLSERGLFYAWLYHAHGEFDRRLQRDLVSLFRRDRGDLGDGIAIVDALGLALPNEQYGATGAQQEEAEEWRRSKLADAFLHPIVHFLRVEEAMDLFAGTDVDWIAANGCNCLGRSHLFDLARLATGLDRELSLYPESVFEDPVLRSRALEWDPLEQVRAFELALKPTGFSIVAGRNDSLQRCTQRLRGNVLRRR